MPPKHKRSPYYWSAPLLYFTLSIHLVRLPNQIAFSERQPKNDTFPAKTPVLYLPRSKRFAAFLVCIKLCLEKEEIIVLSSVPKVNSLIPLLVVRYILASSKLVILSCYLYFDKLPSLRQKEPQKENNQSSRNVSVPSLAGFSETTTNKSVHVFDWENGAPTTLKSNWHISTRRRLLIREIRFDFVRSIQRHLTVWTIQLRYIFTCANHLDLCVVDQKRFPP